MNKNEVMGRVFKLQSDLKGKGVSAYKDYELERHTFHTPRDASELNELTGTWFTNGLATAPVIEVALIYCAYDGIIAIEPAGYGNDSYFEFSSGLNHEDHAKLWTDAIMALWNHLKLL
jgi:hypothetical protein